MPVNGIDLRKAINLISDVVVNRPQPIREVDQIYMKHADMLLQVEHVSKWMNGKRVIFIGDGDGISLCIAHLQSQGIIDSNVQSILVLDFDERIVNSVNSFAQSNRINDLISAKLYNVADPLPEEYWQKYDVFYCNPPYGSSNNGFSIQAFMQRGIEATCGNAIGCVVIADYEGLAWTQDVIYNTQKMALESGFIIHEMLPSFHSYHLDDVPDLTSCSIIFNRIKFDSSDYSSKPLPKEYLENFYGSGQPLKIMYIKDLTEGGTKPVFDYELVEYKEGITCG